MRGRLLFLLLAVGASFAQAPVSDSSSTTELWARPTMTISTATSKPGDVVTLELWKEARDQDGNVFLPKGARLFALLTLVQSRSRDREARLALYVMRAEWKGGFAALNAFLAGPVYQPSETPETSLVSVDRSVVRLVRGLRAKPSSRHAHVRVEADLTYAVAYASRDRDIALSPEVLLPLRDVSPTLLERAAR